VEASIIWILGILVQVVSTGWKYDPVRSLMALGFEVEVHLLHGMVVMVEAIIQLQPPQLIASEMLSFVLEASLIKYVLSSMPMHVLEDVAQDTAGVVIDMD